MKHQLLLMMFILWFTGCEKEKISRQSTSVPKLKYIKTTMNNQDIIQEEYIYDESGNLINSVRYRDYAAGLISGKATYTYQNGRLTQKDESIDFFSSSGSSQYMYVRSVFEYSGDRIIQQNHYLNTNNTYELRSFTSFLYDVAGNPVKQALYTPDGVLSGYTIFTFSGNNVVQSEEYYKQPDQTAPVLVMKRSYRHDNNKNPYRQVYHSIENIPFSINQNNITTTTSVSYSTYSPSTFGLNITTSTSYQYNIFGYPTRMNENGNIFALEYK